MTKMTKEAIELSTPKKIGERKKGKWLTFGDKLKIPKKTLTPAEICKMKIVLGKQYHLFETLFSPTSSYESRLKARNEIALQNKGLSISISLWFKDKTKFKKNSAISLDDLKQVGFIGLMRAIETYNMKKGFCFTTYAFSWIYKEIQIFICDNEAIRIPYYMAEKLSRLDKAIIEFFKQNNRKPTGQELARRLDLTIEEVEDLKKKSWNSRQLISLNSTFNIKDSDELPLIDTVISSTKNFFDDLLDEQQKKEVRDLLDYNELKEREKLLLKYRFGFDIEEAETLQEVGDRLKITKEGARLIQNKVLDKLRKIA